MGDVATRNVERFHVGSKRPLEETGKHARAGELLLGCGGDTHIRHFGVAPWDTGQHWLNDTRPETLRLMTAMRTEMLSPTSQVTIPPPTVGRKRHGHRARGTPRLLCKVSGRVPATQPFMRPTARLILTLGGGCHECTVLRNASPRTFGVVHAACWLHRAQIQGCWLRMGVRKKDDSISWLHMGRPKSTAGR